MTKLQTWRTKATWLSSVGTGVLYGVVERLIFANVLKNNAAMDSGLMTVAFLLGVPVAMGYWTVAEHLRTTPVEEIRWRSWFMLPWLPVGVTLLIAFMLGWEGMICILFAAPVMLIGSSLGGLAAWIVWDRIGARFIDKVSVMVLPLLLLFAEAQIPTPPAVRLVQTQMVIHAPAEVVWNNIKSVRLIAPDELPHSWIERVGFPKPLAATLSHEGVGGVRQASFTGGLLFTETVNQWEPGTDLRFSIRAR